ncbi:hypothetical protein BRADI_1g47693v3 [Brachypodium distachyon]|nr:hypothetical protein BRADI_1g47693v3 [Brachypodium distachyon]
MALSSQGLLDEAASILSPPAVFNPDTFHRLLQETTIIPPSSPLSSSPWELAAGRSEVTEVPYQHSNSLRRVLLDTIHGFYLQALAILPTDDLQSCYHRSLLKAGHCYGPFEDPVSNIILNTVWYEAAFPPPVEDHKLDTLATMSLMRIGVRSFYGLVSHLCTTHQNLTLHQALRCLLDTDLNIQLSHEAAAAMTVNQQQESIAREEAFRAAAIAAVHPKPEEQARFLCSCEAMLAEAGVSLSTLLDGRRQLRSEDAQHLARLLCPEPPDRMPLQQPSVSSPLLDDIMAKGKKQRRALTRISGKVKAALRIYESQARIRNPPVIIGFM